MRSPLQELADRLATEGHFLGGPPKHFDAIGRNQLVNLIEQGLMPFHKVLDVGCGCLRGGYWSLHFLNPGCYFGIEPNAEMLELGKSRIAGDDLIEQKQPVFSNNDDFNFSIFGVKFNFVVARSIWTHAAPWQIERMLDQFVSSSAPNAVFLTSYLPASQERPQYFGKDWVGRSHLSSLPGTVTYELSWIVDKCAERGLLVRELEHNLQNQIWLGIQRQ